MGQPKLFLHGSHGTAHHIKIRKFGTLEEAQEWFHQKGITLCGVELVPQAVDIRTHPFRGDTAIMMGNEVDEDTILPELGMKCREQG